MPYRELRLGAYALMWFTIIGLFAITLRQLLLFDLQSILDWWTTIPILIGMVGGTIYQYAASFNPKPIRDRIVLSSFFGSALLLILTLVDALLTAPFLTDVVTDAVCEFVHALRLSIVLPSCVIAFSYWVYRRTSDVSSLWLENTLPSALLLLIIGGGVTNLPSSFADDFFSHQLRGILAVVGWLSYLIVGAQGFRALSDRNQNRVMSASWASISLVWLVLGGCLGVALSLPDVHFWTTDTLFEEAYTTAIHAAAYSIILAVGNQMAAELRGQNIRVTRWIPFWLVTGGSFLAILGLASAGLVETYLIQILSDARRGHVNEWIRPLTEIWRYGMALNLLGVFVFSVTYFLRRPRSIL